MNDKPFRTGVPNEELCSRHLTQGFPPPGFSCKFFHRVKYSNDFDKYKLYKKNPEIKFRGFRIFLEFKIHNQVELVVNGLVAKVIKKAS